ncbi:MAG: transcription elongation factor GreA [Oscillospiraceae bacterium]|nr:transcription elongation factor GreA [Oscillospiraceae bacterium]
MAVKKVRMSSEGLQRLEAELEHLITVKRAEVAQKLKEARAFGDLSENAEYDEAKNEQGILEARIQEMEYMIANAEIVAESDLSVDEIGIGSIVTMRDMELDEIMTLQIVGSTESDPDNNKISDESPIGLAAMTKHVGDIIEVEAPVGIIQMEIIDIGK